MGLLQKAVETFDANAALVGVVQADRQPLAPVSHTVTRAAVEITVDERGQLVDAVAVDKNQPKIIIPVTEDSVGRTSAACAHPLCDQIGYLSGKDPKKYQLYIDQLQEWAQSSYAHPMLQPILTYVQGKTLLADLEAHGVKATDEKALVRWRVVGIGEDSGNCWTNQALFQSFIDWYKAKRAAQQEAPVLCMVTGDMVGAAHQHLKGVIPQNGNAKLISANDKQNFTYRGRFTDDAQAATVGYMASQKAHNALYWLAANQGVRVVAGGRTFLCWNPQGKPVPHAAMPFGNPSEPSATPTDYRTDLQHTLEGYRATLPDNSGGVVIASFDAATTGRLSLTYYNELRESDFLQRLYDWDDRCCWWKWNPVSRKYDGVQSPSLWQIVACAFGTQRDEKLVPDDRMVGQHIQRLLSCRVDRTAFPLDIKKALVDRASMPQAFSAGVYQRILFTACAVIRKFFYDHNQTKGEITLTLDENREDRSYQFGRLLAVYEKIERDTFERDTTRETNAIRSQCAYRQRPLHIANNLEEKLNQAYMPRLKPGLQHYYRQMIQDIRNKIDSCPEPNKYVKPLGDTYLIGYYHQRSALYTKKQDNQTEQEEK